MFQIKQYLKMLLQNLLLPLVYACFCHAPVRRGTVIFADGHHDEIPFSMRRMYEAVTQGAAAPGREGGVGRSERPCQDGGTARCGRPGQDKGVGRSGRPGQDKGQDCSNEMGAAAVRPVSVEVFVADFRKMSLGRLLLFLLRFMKHYATAEYVFLCDYFLPVAACRKREDTTVVQLWHSCGLMKKIAYDTEEDIPKHYRGNMFGNYTYLTLSSEACVAVHERALRLPGERIRAVGVSRTDYYFDEAWKEGCRARFYEQYPEAAGKKIALWAPTFRGNAAMPRLEGKQEILGAARTLAPDWYFILKAHPHIDAHEQVSNCTIPTEELFAVADVLITDYSSVLFDYLLYDRPIVLFAPDREQYEETRGFYIDYASIPFAEAQTQAELEHALRTCGKWQQEHREAIAQFRELYTGACDGHATERILGLAGLRE